MGIKLISKRQEKQPAGQPELSLPGSLQIILASTSKGEKQAPYANMTVPQCCKTAQVRSNVNSVLMRTKASPVENLERCQVSSPFQEMVKALGISQAKAN